MKFDPATILVLPLVDGHISPQESFCMDGNWVRWGEMDTHQKLRVLKRKLSIAGASKHEAQEEFWQAIATKNGLELESGT